MTRWRYVVSTAFAFLFLTDIIRISYCQFPNGPRQFDPIKNFRNIPDIPRFRGNARIGNFQRTNLNVVQQNNLRFQQQQLEQRLLDRREAEASESDRGYTGGNNVQSQFPNTGFCRDGWTEASLDGVAICIRVNTEPSKWDDAQEKCRQDYSFLLKLEVPIKVQSKSIEDHLLSLGIKNVWTGLHSEHTHLVWDGISPSLVKSESRFEKSPWKFDKNLVHNGNQLCGEIDIQNNSHIVETKRKKRSVGENREKRAPEEKKNRNRFPSFYPSPTPTPSSNENINSNFQKEFSKLNIVDRLRTLNNARRIINFANNRNQGFSNPHNNPIFNQGQVQNKRYGNSQRIRINQKFKGPSVSPNNFRPVNNQRYLNLLKMLRSGSTQIQQDNNNENSDKINVMNQDKNLNENSPTTIKPPEEKDQTGNKNTESLQKIGDLFNKPKTGDDDDSKLKFDKLKEKIMTTSENLQFVSNLNSEIRPTMETIFNTIKKSADTDNKNPLIGLLEANTGSEKKKTSISDVFEKILSEDKPKIDMENDNKNNLGLIDFGFGMPLAVSKQDPSRRININKLPNQPLSVIPTTQVPDNEASITKAKDEDEKKTTDSNLRPDETNFNPISNPPLTIVKPNIPSISQDPNHIAGDQEIHDTSILVDTIEKNIGKDESDIASKAEQNQIGVDITNSLPVDQRKKNDVKQSTANMGIKISSKENLEDEIWPLPNENLGIIQKDQKLDSKVNAKTNEHLPSDINIDKALSDIDIVLAQDDSHSMVVTSPPHPILKDVRTDSKSDNTDENIPESGSIVKQLQRNGAAKGKTDDAKSSHIKGQEEDVNDMLLNILDGIDSHTDVNLNDGTSIERLRKNLERKFIKADNSQQKNTKSMETATEASITHETPVSKDSIVTETDVKALSNDGLILQTSHEETTDDKVENKNGANMNKNLYGKIIDEKFGGNVGNILKILNKMSETKPTEVPDHNVFGSSVVQNMMTNDREAASIAYSTTPSKPKKIHDGQMILPTAESKAEESSKISQDVKTASEGIVIIENKLNEDISASDTSVSADDSDAPVNEILIPIDDTISSEGDTTVILNIPDEMLVESSNPDLDDKTKVLSAGDFDDMNVDVDDKSLNLEEISIKPVEISLQSSGSVDSISVNDENKSELGTSRTLSDDDIDGTNKQVPSVDGITVTKTDDKTSEKSENIFTEEATQSEDSNEDDTITQTPSDSDDFLVEIDEVPPANSSKLALEESYSTSLEQIGDVDNKENRDIIEKTQDIIENIQDSFEAIQSSNDGEIKKSSEGRVAVTIVPELYEDVIEKIGDMTDNMKERTNDIADETNETFENDSEYDIYSTEEERLSEEIASNENVTSDKYLSDELDLNETNDISGEYLSDEGDLNETNDISGEYLSDERDSNETDDISSEYFSDESDLNETGDFSDEYLSDERDSNETNDISGPYWSDESDLNETGDFSDEHLSDELDLNGTNDIEILNGEHDMEDILQDTSDDISEISDNQNDKFDEQFNDTDEIPGDDLDVNVDEKDNVAKEIISESDELSQEVSSQTDENISDDILNQLSNSTSIDVDESFENTTDSYDSSDEILVSEAAAQDDAIHQREFRDLDPEEDVEEFVPPEDIVEHIPKRSENIEDTKNLIMRLGSCEKPKPSVCFTQPITVDTTVSMCGIGWYGNVFVDKCFRYISEAMTFTFARDTCIQEGGQLASVDNSFLRRFILTSVALARYNSNIQSNIINVWIHSETKSNQCRQLNNIGVQNANCLTLAEAVCERPKQQIKPFNEGDLTDHDFEYVQPEVKQFKMESADNKLECPLNNEHPELPVMWYKDGIPLTPKLTKESKSITFPSLSNIDATLTSDLYLTTDLSRSLDFNDSNDTMEILQGRYWCEVWTSNPFKRLESKPTLIRYSDVMSFVGFLNIHPLTVYERTVYNMMNEKSLAILNVVKDLQTIHDSILSDIQLIVPEVVTIKVKPDFVESGKQQRLKFYTHVTMSTTYTMATERSINVHLRSELKENLQNTSFMLSLPGRTPIHQARSLKFYSTVACPMDQLKDKETSLVATFPSSATGLEVTSIETCEGEVAGRAKCDGDFETGAHWTDVRVFKTCNNNGDDDSENTDSSSEEQDDATVMGHISRERRLKELAEVDVEDNNAETVMEETAEIIENAQEITAEYIDYIAEIVDKTSEVTQATKMTSENIVKTVDRILDIDDDEIKKSTKANSIIKSLEKVAGKMNLDVNGQFRIVTPNVALEVWDLKYQSLPIIGLAAREDQKKKEFDESQIITLYNRSQIYFDDLNAAIELPPELVEEVMTEQESRLYMMVYRHGRLFQTMTEAQVNLEQNREAQFVDDSGTLNSFVISASIGGKKIENLKNHVKTIFKPLKDVKGKEKTCAHWDFTLNNNRGGWSAKGCVYNGTVNGRDICLCNHLTNFAVLIDFYGQAEPIPEHHEISLSIISLIGLSLSILGLSLTIISYAFFRKLRRGRAQQTLFNLALSMLCSWVVFLTGIRQTHSFYGCIVVAVLLHYFILSSFMWMLMEAFLQYLTFVKVLGTYVTRYRLKTVLVAWGLPLVPVVSVLSIDYTLYSGGSRYCWMSLTAFYYSFAIPVGLIILCNLTVFVVTVISICRRPTGLRTNQSKSKMAMANLQAAITSFVLLGLTWFLGYLAISDARLPFQYAFTILNSLQGFFIFILFVLRKKRVRDQWLILCCCKVPEQEKALRSLSASGSIPSTGSGRSSYSGRSERSDSTRTTTSFVNDSYDSLFFPFKSSRPTLYYREKSNSITSE
ncbi:uncharacterized protein LOC134727351 [Mytilus trossulus]|uniref:uncharacterized protein LOC134727351 n=1 Tax=Mytilus trossulus TaxID=6551 RepID=UPI003004EA1D